MDDPPNAARRNSPLLRTDHEQGRRNRRLIDVPVLFLMATLIVLAAQVARSAAAADADVGQAFVTVLGWAAGLWRTVGVLTVALAVLVLVTLAIHRRWALARDVGVALVLVLLLGAVSSRLVGSDGLAFDDDPWSRWGFPDQRLALVVAAATVVSPELNAPARRVLWWLVALAGVGQVALEAARPSDALGAAALGLAAGAVIRLLFGSVAGVPSSADVQESLAALGIAVADLRPSPRQQLGESTYVGRDGNGQALQVRVLGRDSQDSQRLARRWRLLAYRDPPRSAPVGRLEQVEHEALATLMAAQAGVRVPAVVIAALGRGGHAGIVTRRGDVATLEASSGDDTPETLLVDLWRQVATMHAAGISHGRLNTAHVIVDNGHPVLVGFAAATLGAPAWSLDIDAAELLVSTTVLVGPERALRAATEGAGTETVTRALPYLQRAALTPHTRDLARSSEVALKHLRRAAAAAAGTDPPEIAPLRRFRWRDLLMTLAVGLAIYLLIGQLADIGFGTLADALADAEPTWLLTALLLAQLALVPEAVSLRGAVLTALPLGPCILLKSAQKFIGITVPGSAGTVAATVRFVQRMGGKAGEAVASGGVDDLAEKLVQVAIVAAMVPLAGLTPDLSGLEISAPDGRLVVGLVVAAGIGAVLIWKVPALHQKVIPQLRAALGALRVLTDRRKRLQLFGGNLAGELAFALTLGAVCLGYGVDLSIPELLLINVGATVLSSLIPVPGGVGAAEATLTAALVTFGVDESTAFAIAITHRMCNNYLPPIWGYWSLRWLRQHDYL